MSRAAHLRAQHILDAARRVTGRELTMFELAAECGRLPGQAFSRDLSTARHMALDADERITECYWNDDGAQVLTHLMPDQEAGRGVWGLLPHGMDVATRGMNLQRHGDWERRHAVSPEDRKVGEIAEHMGAAVAHMGAAFRLSSETARERRAANAQQE